MKVVPKIWGEERWIVNNNEYCGKQLILKAGFQSSLHYHKNKFETFYIHFGKVLFELEQDDGIQKFILLPEAIVDIHSRRIHRFTGLENSVIFEFSTYHDDADVYRLEESKKVGE